MKDDPLPRLCKIEEDRLRPGIREIQEVARHPALVAPKFEQIGRGHTIVEEEGRADADAGNLERRRRRVLEPEPRPCPADSRQLASDIACERQWPGHLMCFSMLTVTNSGSKGCLSLR